MGKSELELERDRLQNAVAHLERSNAELGEAIAETGPDREYKTAIEDNIVTIARYRAHIAALEEEIQRITGQASNGQPVSVPVDPQDEEMTESQQTPSQQQQQQQHQQHQQHRLQEQRQHAGDQDDTAGQQPGVWL
eukprot:jgi/Chrzof1/1492/Cz10g09250.t1